MTEVVSMSIHLDLTVLLIILLALPIVYFVISYYYLVLWHHKLFIWVTVIHENGRLTLLGSLFYFDHFVACVPMVTLFALCAAGGFFLGGDFPLTVDMSSTRFVALTLLLCAALLVSVVRNVLRNERTGVAREREM